MRNVAILIFVRSLVNSWSTCRAKCLCRMVIGLMHAGRLGVAAIGRRIPGITVDKHRIKAVDRFIGNEHVELSSVFASLMDKLRGSGPRVYVLLDWTDLHDEIHETLVAAVCVGGRAIPVAWGTSKKQGHYLRSRNRLEHAMCSLVRSLVPREQEVVIVADRGFCRASFFRGLRRSRIRFVVRIRKDVHIIDHRGSGPVGNRSIARGQLRDLAEVQYGDDARVDLRCVLTFGLGDGRTQPKSPWYLVTDLEPHECNAAGIVAIYKRRMRIEHLFRDEKSYRFGFQLRGVCLSTAERYDRLLLIAAIAALGLVLLGAYVEAHGMDRGFRANTERRHRTHSLFQLGLAFLDRLRLRRLALEKLLTLCLDSAPCGDQ